MGQPPVHFGTSENLRWSTELDGIGWSSPVYADGKVWLTAAIVEPASEEEIAARHAAGMAKLKKIDASVVFKAYCVDWATGQLLRDITLAETDNPDPINPLNSYASPTPVISDGHVYCDFGNYGTWCLDFSSGETIWQRSIDVDYSVGAGSSPIVYQENLILVCDGIDQQFLVALNKHTGKEVWRTPRPEMRATEVEFKKAYSTPILVNVTGRDQLIAPSAQWLCAYDPLNGKELWRFDHGQGFSVSPSAVQTPEGLVVFSTGFMRPELVAVDPNGEGDVTKTHQKWRISRTVPTKPSPIVVGEYIYMLSDSGVLTQLLASDGSIHWQERLAGQFSASPILADGKLYLCSHEGRVYVIEAGSDFRLLAENEIGEQIMASPAVVDNDLIVRSGSRLYRFGQ